MKWAFIHLVTWAVVIAVAASLWSEGYTWEGILVGLFSGLPVFFLGAWLAARGDV